MGIELRFRPNQILHPTEVGPSKNSKKCDPAMGFDIKIKKGKMQKKRVKISIHDPARLTLRSFVLVTRGSPYSETVGLTRTLFQVSLE